MQTVLIGGSTSSSDIAKELEGIAKKVYQSTRNGAFDQPASMLPPGITRVSEISLFNLEKQSGLTPEDAAIPGNVTLVDGQILANIDRYVKSLY
jgi:hypothetical protein